MPWSDIKAPEERKEIVALMLDKGAGIEGDALVDLIRADLFDAVRTIISRGKAQASYLNQALAAAKRGQHADLVELRRRQAPWNQDPSTAHGLPSV